LLATAAGCGDDDDDSEPAATAAAATEAPVADTAPDESAPSDTGSDESEPSDTGSGGEAPDESIAPPMPATTGEGTPVEVTLTETSIDGLPSELAAGLVDLTVTDETESAGGDINFTLVDPGTDEDAFRAGLIPVFDGGPFPEFFLNNAGAIGSSTLTLDQGEYIVWVDLASNLERPSTAEDIITAPLTVGPGDDEATITETDGTVTSTDYDFSIDVTAGETIVSFTNNSANQFHHVVLVDFGTNDPALVEGSLLELLESEEDAPPPEGLDMSEVNFDLGGSGVFGPGMSGTFAAAFEEGTTYAALCFLQDRVGGPPHAIHNEMFEVFQV
jgi:hypothetical protein